ncbi:MAG: amino acid dehydrogenase, partial [Rhodopila sp.]
PCIGPASGCADVVHAFGHGHVGLASAVTTGTVVADLVAGRVPPFNLTSYAASRFRRWAL